MPQHEQTTPADASKGHVLIIGNGPSLRAIDFSRFEGFDTIGMNAAYRYWDRIDWRPTHYVCLDDALIDTHHVRISELIAEGRVRTFFLTARFLEFHPDLASHENIRYLDEFVEHWANVRGSSLGLSFQDHEAFRTSEPDYVTTGAYSVRYAALLGYKSISLLGVDLNYQDVPGSETLDEVRLKLSQTPGYNPNYFFDDYQQTGDEFHVPNPASHAHNLHEHAFRVVRNDFHDQGLGVDIRNTSRGSRLVSQSIFPFEPMDRALQETALSAVIVPAVRSDIEQIIHNLRLWNEPAFFPFLGKLPKQKPVLAFVFNNAEAAERGGEIEICLDELPRLKSCFSGFRFVSLDLSGDADIYQLNEGGAPGALGRRAGPNNLFFGALEAVGDLPGFSLLIEADCTPMRPDWLGALNRLLSTSDLPWVLGSHYLGGDPLSRRDFRHLNGNAVYATGDPDFQKFVAQVWRPRLASFIKERPELPYDCFLEALFEAADPLDPQDEDWAVARSVAHRFRPGAYLANFAGEGLTGSALAETLTNLLASSPDLHIVHSRALAEQTKRLIRDNIVAEPLSLLTLLSGQPARANPKKSESGLKPLKQRVKSVIRGLQPQRKS